MDGLVLMDIAFTLFIILLETFAKNSTGRWAQSAVIPSVDVTALNETTFS